MAQYFHSVLYSLHSLEGTWVVEMLESNGLHYSDAGFPKVDSHRQSSLIEYPGRHRTAHCTYAVQVEPKVIYSMTLRIKWSTATLYSSRKGVSGILLEGTVQ